MSSPQSRIILVVEDDLIVAVVVKKTLENHGFVVRGAKSGEQAVAAVDADPAIDLILMDIDLGSGIDGTEAARRILAHHDLPVVFHSAHTEREVVEKTEEITSYGYIVKNSGETVLIASIKMAFRLFDARMKEKEREAALVHSQSLLDQMGRMAKVAGWQTDVVTGRMEWTAELYNIYELDPTSTMPIEQEFERCLTPASRQKRLCAIRRTMETGEPYDIEIEIVTPSGAHKWVHILGRAVYEDGKIVRRVGTFQDITDRKRAEMELVANNELLFTIVNNTPDAIFYKDAAGRYRLVNNAKVEQFNARSADEILGKTVYDFFPKEQADIFAEIERQYLDPKTPRRSWVEQVQLLSGETVWHHNTKAAVQDADGRAVGVVTICRDITKEKLSEASVQGLIAEKELLLQEAHHRVKNNMIVVQALLTLQAELGRNPEIRNTLLGVAGRVRRMASLYERLYRSEYFDRLEMDAFFPPLIQEIVAVFPDRPRVKTELRIEPIALGPRTLSPLGIIVNELITNSMKYAFTGRDSGTITLSAQLRSGQVTMAYEDDGVGLPKSVDLADTGGFGMKLVNLLSAQIGGMARIERPPVGTRIVIEFGV